MWYALEAQNARPPSLRSPLQQPASCGWAHLGHLIRHLLPHLRLHQHAALLGTLQIADQLLHLQSKQSTPMAVGDEQRARQQQLRKHGPHLCLQLCHGVRCIAAAWREGRAGQDVSRCACCTARAGGGAGLLLLLLDLALRLRLLAALPAGTLLLIGCPRLAPLQLRAAALQHDCQLRLLCRLALFRPARIGQESVCVILRGLPQTFTACKQPSAGSPSCPLPPGLWRQRHLALGLANGGADGFDGAAGGLCGLDGANLGGQRRVLQGRNGSRRGDVACAGGGGGRQAGWGAREIRSPSARAPSHHSPLRRGRRSH